MLEEKKAKTGKWKIMWKKEELEEVKKSKTV